MNVISFRRVSNDTQGESGTESTSAGVPALASTTNHPSSGTLTTSKPTLMEYFKPVPRISENELPNEKEPSSENSAKERPLNDVSETQKGEDHRSSESITTMTSPNIENSLTIRRIGEDVGGKDLGGRDAQIARVDIPNHLVESSQGGDSVEEASQNLDGTQQDDDDDDPGFLQKSQRDDEDNEDNDDGRIERPKEPNYKPPACPFHVTKHLIVDCFGDPPNGPIPSKIPTERIFLKNYRARRMYDDLECPTEKTFYVQFIDEEGRFNVMYEKGDENKVFTADNATGAWGPVVEARSQHYKCNSKVSGPKQFGITQDRVRRIICNIVMDREITDDEWQSVNSQSLRPQKEPTEKVATGELPSNEKVHSHSRKRKRKPSEQQQLTLKLQKRKQEAPVVEKKSYSLQGYVRENEQEFQKNFRLYFENLILGNIGETLSKFNAPASSPENGKESSELNSEQHNSHKSHPLSQCFVCKLGVRQQHHHTLQCNLCHRDYHMTCIAYDHIVTNNNNNGWICPSHRCCSCGVSSVNIKCAMCPNSLCVQCQPFRMISEEACSGFCLCILCSDIMKKSLADSTPAPHQHQGASSQAAK